jgi:phosphoglucan,water dikinase
MRAALRFLAAAADATALSAGGGGGEEFGHVAHQAGELATAGVGGMPPAGDEGALRVRAVAERARRAAEDYCALLSELFDGRAEALGNSLGMDGGTVAVFTEGQIRASVVFQSAKLASHLLRAARAATGEAGWDCLVPGEVDGVRLVSVERLDPSDPIIAALTAGDPAVLLVMGADGDEEVSTCGPGVAGILLCHALPHLSHLALRARQAGVPLVAIEDPELVAHAQGLERQGTGRVRFVAQPSNVSLDASEGGGGGGGGGGFGGAATAAAYPAAALVADTSYAGAVIPLAELGFLPWHQGVALAGSKAAP